VANRCVRTFHRCQTTVGRDATLLCAIVKKELTFDDDPTPALVRRRSDSYDGSDPARKAGSLLVSTHTQPHIQLGLAAAAFEEVR
jgi:hypothetical protein